MNYIFLTNQFYTDYARFPEIEKKSARPYVQVHITVKGIDFAIPLRSNISHNYVLWTDKANRCGVDFSKAIVIEDFKYVDTVNKPHIRPNEHKALIGRERDVEAGMLSYINRYKAAKKNPNNHAKQYLLKYSTLQYFEKYI